jgi:hypothetical protein
MQGSFDCWTRLVPPQRGFAAHFRAWADLVTLTWFQEVTRQNYVDDSPHSQPPRWHYKSRENLGRGGSTRKLLWGLSNTGRAMEPGNIGNGPLRGNY